MAVTKGKLTMADGQEFELVILMGDRMRAVQENPEGTSDEVLTNYAVFIAAKRCNLPATSSDFYRWADNVADWDVELTEKRIAELEALGEIDADQAQKLRALYVAPTAAVEEPEGEADAATCSIETPPQSSSLPSQ